MAIDRKVFLTSVEQDAIAVLAKMPENYGKVLKNTAGNEWAVQVLEEERNLLDAGELAKVVLFPKDFYTLE